MSDLTTTDLGQAGAAIEAEEARKVIEGLRAENERMRELLREIVAEEYVVQIGYAPLTALKDRIRAALGGKP